MSERLKPGAIVRSIKVRSRAAFIGTVIGDHPGKSRQYLVRDAAGLEWCRHGAELERVKQSRPQVRRYRVRQVA